MRRARALFGALVVAGGLTGATTPTADASQPTAPGVPLCTLEGDELPFGRSPCPGVRPGGLVRSIGGSCTLNFLFEGSDGERYIGTAGHCLWEDDEPNHADETWAAGKGNEATVDGERIGEFAFGVWKGDYDFALIRLDPGVAASPEMCHFGGPTELYTEHSPKRLDLHHYGHGIGFGSTHAATYGIGDENHATLPARSGFAWQTESKVSVYAMAAALFGDSGSGAIDAHGRAVGVLVQLNITDEYGHPAPIRLTRLDLHLARAEAAMDIDLTLQTAPVRTLEKP